MMEEGQGEAGREVQDRLGFRSYTADNRFLQVPPHPPSACMARQHLHAVAAVIAGGDGSWCMAAVLLQANKRSELVFTNHSFEAWEGWLVEGADLEACRLVHGKLRSLSLQVAIEVLAAPQDDGVVTRWLG
eukprot:SM000111S18771  [mRNA]  locus=s111:30618:31275:- [translate_table: standard]